MSVTASQSITIGFRVEDSSGQLVDADSLPTAVLYRNGDVTAVVVTVASVTGDGKYKASWTNADYSDGDVLEVEATSVVGGESYTALVWRDTVIDSAAIRATIGLASANLDTQLGYVAGQADAIIELVNVEFEQEFAVIGNAIATVDGVVDAIKAVTDKTNTTLESDGSGGYRLTESATSNISSSSYNPFD